MKKSITTLLLTLSLFTVTTQKSHAVVGLLLGNPAVTAVGGLATLGGFVFMNDTSGDIAQNFRRGFGGLIAAVVGITLLSESQTAEIQFQPILSSPRFTADELETYNSELSELNAINQTITAEIAANPKNTDSEALWNEYGAVLSPDTIKVAAYTSNKLIKALK